MLKITMRLRPFPKEFEENAPPYRNNPKKTFFWLCVRLSADVSQEWRYMSVTVYVRQFPGFLCVQSTKYKDDFRNTPLRFSLLDMRESQRHCELQAA